MKKEYEMPQADIVKFSMDTDIMSDSTTVNTEEFSNAAGLGGGQG